MKALAMRLIALERQDEPKDGRLLPTVVDDDAPQSVLDAIRARGIECYRWSDAAEVFV